MDHCCANGPDFAQTPLKWSIRKLGFLFQTTFEGQGMELFSQGGSMMQQKSESRMDISKSKLNDITTNDVTNMMQLMLRIVNGLEIEWHQKEC